MISLTRKDKDNSSFILNHRLIERIMPLKDTIILLENEKTIIVKESPEQVIEKIIDFESEVAFRVQKKKDVTKL